MLKLLLGLVMLGALAVFVAAFPLHGHTVLERWNSSRSPREFLERGYDEAKVAFVQALGAGTERPPSARATTRHTERTATRQPPGPPVEQHTDSDRAALDRIVAEHTRR